MRLTIEACLERMRERRLHAALAALLLCALIPIGAGGQRRPTPNAVWWEAESPKTTNFPPPAQNPFRPNTPAEAGVLSGGQWIGAAGDRTQTLFLEYQVATPKAGEYQFYARKFWKHGPFRWRFDAQPWQEVGRDVVLLDEAPMRQFVGANWVRAGTARLAAGAHTLRIELLEKTGAAAFDAFLLTLQPLTPRGKLKPGEKYSHAPAGWFPFEPEPDPFSPSPIDLRPLNEKFAGENGFIQVRGDQFVHQKTGRPVRFWGVNVSGETVNLDAASAAYLARSLAKQGVNLVRIHGPLWGANFRQADRAHLERLFAFVAALKKEGIYTALSIYFPLWLQLKEGDGFAGYTGKNPFALLFFNPEFQAVYRGWWEAALTTPDPHTGKPLNQEPAVAILEMVNEDSNLFWTFQPYNTIPGPQMEILEKQFGRWLGAKYGSLDRAFTAWGGGRIRGDDAAAGRAGFRPIYEVFNQRDLRSQDTAAFLTDNQKAFFQQTYAYLKKDLGFRGAVYASNWITASPDVLGPLDKQSNAVADFMDHHGYFGGLHQGERASYSISKGDRYDDRCALLFTPAKPGGAPDYSLPLMDIQYDGKPSTITEINWTQPNRYRADLPLLCAAYGLLQGTDAFYFFASGSPSWEQVLGKFAVRTPAIAGQFPAAAFIYRQGLVRTADFVVEANLKEADLKALKGAPVSAPANLDELRARDIPPGKTAVVERLGSIDPLAFLAGRVSIRFTPEGGPSRVADLSRWIDRAAKTVRSATGELVWDYGNGKVTLNAPQAQAATGFLAKGGPIRLADATIQAGMEYGTVILIALDGKPLAQSDRMLLQVMSEESNDGWDAPGTGLREIRSVGGPPVVVRKFSGTVSLRRPDAERLRVTALDFDGYPAQVVGSARDITLRESTMYYLIERGG